MISPVPSARSLLGIWATSPDSEREAARGALLVAAEEYPQLSIAHYIQRFELFAERVRDRLADESAPPVVLQELNHVLYREQGFRCATAKDDARACYLNDVLDRRLGSPLALAIIHLEVGWRLDLSVQCVAIEGGYLVGYRGDALRLYVDPREEGRLRFEDEVAAVAGSGGAGRADPAPSREAPAMERPEGWPEHIRPLGSRDIVVRLLRELQAIHLAAGDMVRALAAVERILVVRPESAEALRDRGLLLARAGRNQEAAADLEAYLDMDPGAADARRIAMLVAALRRGTS